MIAPYYAFLHLHPSKIATESRRMLFLCQIHLDPSKCLKDFAPHLCHVQLRKYYKDLEYRLFIVCIPEFRANFLFFWRVYGLVFYPETIAVS